MSIRLPSVFTVLCGCLVLAACSSVEHDLPLEPTATVLIRVGVASASGDAEETQGNVQLGDEALDFTTGNVVGLRFEGLGIPQGATITSAHIEFRAITSSGSAATILIRGDASEDATAFSNRWQDLSSRGATTASATWHPQAWTAHHTEQTPSLTGVVQEIVNRREWQRGDAVGFTLSTRSGRRAAVSYDKRAAHAPVLVVAFGVGKARPSPTPTSLAASATAQGEWHKRLLATISNPRFHPDLDPKKLAAYGDLFRLGRQLNEYMTGLILAYRKTGNPVIAKQIDTILNIAKSKLRDTNGDGYQNWTYQADFNAEARLYYGRDDHRMDEMLTHSMVASAAYTLKQAGYSSSAAFWTDYLRNDFEAKWRKRNNKPTGFPFLDHKLMHPSTSFIRYHLYMYKLTGKSEYYDEAKRLAGLVKDTMRLSDGGYVWSHFRGTMYGCQPMVYVRFTTQALADLATADPNLFDATFMKRVAHTMAYKALKDIDGTKLAGNSCGTGGTYGSVRTFSQSPYAQLVPWDGSGRLETATERAYAVVERENLASPKSSNTPAIMVFLGR